MQQTTPMIGRIGPPKRLCNHLRYTPTGPQRGIKAGRLGTLEQSSTGTTSVEFVGSSVGGSSGNVIGRLHGIFVVGTAQAGDFGSVDFGGFGGFGSSTVGSGGSLGDFGRGLERIGNSSGLASGDASSGVFVIGTAQAGSFVGSGLSTGLGSFGRGLERIGSSSGLASGDTSSGLGSFGSGGLVGSAAGYGGGFISGTTGNFVGFGR